MNIKFYIMSRGKAPEQDYKWVYLTSKGQRIEQPSDLSDGQIDKLVYREAFSLFIGRYQGNLVLQVTGLTAKNRQDYQQRNLRNSLLCIGMAHDERILRGIAVAALEGRLDTILDNAISFISTEPGFFADPGLDVSLIKEQLTDSDKTLDVVPLPQQLGKNTPERRLLLGKQIEGHNLPMQDGPLVVVTDFISRETFENIHVWLGLSNLIDDSPAKEQPVKARSGYTSTFPVTPTSKLSTNASTQRLIVAVVIVLLLITNLLTYFATSHNVDIGNIRATAIVQSQATASAQAHIQAQVAATATVRAQLATTTAAQLQEDNVQFIYISSQHPVKNGNTIVLYVAVQNTGQSTWSAKGGYHLACVDPQDPDCQQAEFSPLQDPSVPPGGSYVFAIMINAHFARPNVADKTPHSFEVRLTHENKQFGEKQTLSYLVIS